MVYSDSTLLALSAYGGCLLNRQIRFEVCTQAIHIACMACPRCDILVQRSWNFCDSCGFQLNESKRKAVPQVVLPDLLKSRHDIYSNSRSASQSKIKAPRRKPQTNSSRGPRSTSTAGPVGTEHIDVATAFLERDRCVCGNCLLLNARLCQTLSYAFLCLLFCSSGSL